MNRPRNPDEHQSALFESYSSEHDYGGKFDDGEFGHEFPFVQAREISPGAHVTLGDRAAALDVVMAYYNKRNMTKGSEKQLAIPGSDFNARYQYPEAVQAGAERKTHVLYRAYVHAMDVLAGVESMQDAGAHWSDIEVEWIRNKYEINEEFLDGKATPEKRAKAVAQAKKTAGQILK